MPAPAPPRHRRTTSRGFSILGHNGVAMLSSGIGPVNGRGGDEASHHNRSETQSASESHGSRVSPSTLGHSRREHQSQKRATGWQPVSGRSWTRTSPGVSPPPTGSWSPPTRRDEFFKAVSGTIATPGAHVAPISTHRVANHHTLSVQSADTMDRCVGGGASLRVRSGARSSGQP